MSRWPSALAAIVLAGCGAAPERPAPEPVRGEPIAAKGEPIELPVGPLDGAIEVTDARVDLAADVLFAFDSAQLTRRARAVLDAAADAVRDERRVRVVGHTDPRGTEAYNQRLSERRARVVAQALRRRLGGAVTLTATGRGERDGRGRRVELRRG